MLFLQAFLMASPVELVSNKPVLADLLADLLADPGACHAHLEAAGPSSSSSSASAQHRDGQRLELRLARRVILHTRSVLTQG